MSDLISKLSEIRNKYNCFDEGEEPYYRALSEAIKILSQLEDGDTINRQEAIDAQEAYMAENTLDGYEDGCSLIHILKDLEDFCSRARRR